MMLTGARSVVVSFGRCVCTTPAVVSTHKAFRKVLLREEKRRRWHTHEQLPKVADAVAAAPAGKGKTKIPKNLPRLRALNKTYLDKIADIISAGDLGSQIYGKGLELSEVRLHPDLKGINVYWIASGEPETDAKLESFLITHAREIRHQLSALRILGHSPPLTFIKDHRYHKLQEVEKMLAVADYGDDFEPSDPTHHLRSSIITTTSTKPLSPRLKVAVEDLNKQREGATQHEELDPFEEALRIANTWTQDGEPITTTTTTATTTAGDAVVTLPKDLPTMRGDVLGVNTTKIYKMIQQNMTKAKAEHRKRDDELVSDPSGSVANPSDTPYPSSSRRKEIQEWASRYNHMKKEKRRKNKEEAMLSAGSWERNEDYEEDEEVEVCWDEEYEEEEEYKYDKFMK